MPNDHYISQFLTAPWEFRDRKLRVFDFRTRAFSDVSSKRLFARIGINSPSLESWFNRMIETPAAKFAGVLRKGGPLQAPKEPTVQRALALLFLLSAARIKAGLPAEAPDTSLEAEAPNTRLQVLAKDEAFCERATRYFFDRHKVACVRVPSERQMFFTEAVTFVYPMPDSPVMAIPLGLNHAVLAYDGPLDAETLLRDVNRSLLASFSVGVGLNVQRVILPPALRESSLSGPVATTDGLLKLRESLQQVFDLVGRASLQVGLRGWGVTK